MTPLLRPGWTMPPGVDAAMSMRAGGVSNGPYGSLNLGVAVGDEPAAVAENRARFAAALGARPVWLRQVHGVQVVRLTLADTAVDTPADAAWTNTPGVACTVQVADCLPVLMAAKDGRAVAAAHAGWRGLHSGVLEATVAALCGGSGARPEALQAWLGPCIGPGRFEVGADVRAAFADHGDCFAAKPPAADGAARWWADLAQLALRRLRAVGVGAVEASAVCSASDPERFFSYRRDGAVSGRMAAAIWRVAQPDGARRR